MSRVLQVRNVSKRYGGLQVLKDVTFEARPGEVLGIIGPNGAGKTTLLNIMTGYTPLDSGSVSWDGREIHQRRPDQLRRLGVSRSFQDGRAFTGLSVGENLQLATRLLLASSAPSHRTQERVHEYVRTRLDQRTRVAALPHGGRMLLGLYFALLSNPSVVIFDEPVAGIDPEQGELLLSVFEELRAEGAILVVVEHHLDFIVRTCARVVVLNFGEVIAVDTPEAVQQHPQVRTAYLGLSDE